MSKQIWLTSLLFLGFSLGAFGQSKVSLSGYVKDAQSGETMIGATIFLPGLQQGTYSNEYGFYSLTLPPGSYEVVFRYVGFQSDTLKIDLQQDFSYTVNLSAVESSLKEVVIQAETTEDRLANTEVGTEQLTIERIKELPVLFGETDVLKSIQLLPGVKPAGEGNSGFFVRGGGADQNLILLDEAPVYNPSHLLGFFSVFNGDAIKSTKLYKGNMPASYGGRLSSVLDVRMNDGNMKNYELSGGIGLISSRLTFEGPIVEDKGSFMVSGRRTYADAFLAFSSDSTLNNTDLYFYDLNLKANYELGDKDRIYLSGYFGRDKFGFDDNFGLDWGNATATLRWNHLFNDQVFLNSSLIYSDYDNVISFGDAQITSGIQDFNWMESLSWYINPNQTLEAGINAIYHTFIPGAISSDDEQSPFNNTELPERYGLETAAYVNHEVKLGKQLSVNYGLRASMFTVLGPGTTYDYDAEGNIMDSTVYESGEVIENYAGLEPRISASFLVNERISVKGAYSRNRQYVHLLSNSTTTSPVDVWIPSSETVLPEISDQVSLGYYQNFPWTGYELSAEVYYKDLQNQIEYRDGANLLLNETVENELTFGSGYSYGVELMFRKTKGKFTGWASYTWSRTMRQFDEINGGAEFSARQDRTHDFSLVGVYTPSDAWSFSASWVYYTGDAVTFPSGSYVIDGLTVPYYTERNGYRMPDYHRLDLSATWFGKDPRTNL
ncbi:MAG: TonB-dependent receptor, partial [Bacteroidota bacterium]